MRSAILAIAWLLVLRCFTTDFLLSFSVDESAESCGCRPDTRLTGDDAESPVRDHAAPTSAVNGTLPQPSRREDNCCAEENVVSDDSMSQVSGTLCHHFHV